MVRHDQCHAIAFCGAGIPRLKGRGGHRPDLWAPSGHADSCMCTSEGQPLPDWAGKCHLHPPN